MLFGTIIRSAPLTARVERRVEQPEGADDALVVDPAALELDALADTEGPRTQQHHPREQVAQGLLGRQARDDRREGRAHGQRLGLDPGDPEGDQQHDHHAAQSHEEPHGAGGGGVHPAEEGRPQ
jgi:hypothetical protein